MASDEATSGDPVRRLTRRGDALVWLVFALGVAWSCWLIGKVPDEVFYSGDGGVKALLVKQFVAGQVTPDLRLAASPPVLDAWRDGLYPLRPPFVYPTPSGQLVSFPMLFAVVSTPFFALLGWRGFYVVPALALWLTWWLFCRTLAEQRCSPAVRATCLALLVFATHLTLYAATFWEHTLGVLLCYVGIDFVFLHARRPFGAVSALLRGLAFGLAFAVRSEALLLIVALGAQAALAGRKQSTRAPLFLVGTALAVAGVLLFNGLTYGHVLGMHSRQILDELSLAARAVGALDRGARLLANLLLHVPVLPIVLGYAGLRWYERRRVDWQEPETILLPCLVFLATVPLIVPNPGARQLGPRYLLCIVPAILLCVAVLLGRASDALPRRRLAWAGVGLALLLGTVQNSGVQAAQMVAEYESRILPALAVLRRLPSRLVVVNDSRLTQELAAQVGEKAFVLAWSEPQIVRAFALAKQLGEPRPVLLSFVGQDDIAQSAPAQANVRSLGIHGTIRVYEANPPGP